MFRPALILISLFLSSAFADPYEGQHLGLNLGLSTTKNFLGGFYSWDRNQINLGTNLTLFTFEEGIFLAQPSITYNRYLTANGLYTSLGLMATYKPDSYDIYTPPTPPETHGTWTQHDEPNWRTNYMTLGFGKNFQWRHWGANLDANLITPINDSFGKEWGVWFGGGFSYRFKLD